MASAGSNESSGGFPDETAKTYDRFVVVLNEDEQSAVDAWKQTHQIELTGQALRELIRLGLLSAVSQSFDTVESIRKSVG